MAVLHTPRTIVAIGRAMLRRRRRLASANSAETTAAAAASFVGLAPKAGEANANPHVYRSNLNLLWDADYMGHMNNAAYLTHAEYARWEWMVENGTLTKLYQSGIHFMVTNASIRFRKEIPPSKPFEIHTVLTAFDDRNLWMHQTFRGKSDDYKGNGRILAQVLVQAVAVRDRKVISPRTMLEAAGVPDEQVDSLEWKDANMVASSESNDDDDAMSFLRKVRDLDEAFKKEASVDDERVLSSKERAN